MTNLCVVRQTLHSFYTTRKGALTLKNVLVALKADNSERQIVSEKNAEKSWFSILYNGRKRGYF
jgi:hypothetical protein